jgi:hypothetical protein
MDRLDEAIKLLADIDHSFVDAPERCQAIGELRRKLDQLDCQWLTMVGEADRREDAPRVDCLTTKAMLQRRVSLSDGAASRALGYARRLHKLPHVTAAFAGGHLSKDHAETIARAYTPARADALAGLEATLVEQAQTTSVEELRSVVKHVTDALDGDGGATEFMDQFAARRFDIAKTMHGTVVGSFVLDPDTGDLALRVFDDLVEAQRDHETGDDGEPERTPTQRRADAFRTMCGIIDRAPKLAKIGVQSRRHPRQGLVVADVEVIERRAGAELVATIRAEAAHVGRLSPETSTSGRLHAPPRPRELRVDPLRYGGANVSMRRLTCDAAISRVITDGPSQILDLGRQTRTVSDAQWRALVARDKHCTHKGCRVPPGFCEAHHIDHWEHGGPTDLNNLKLYCWRHHIAEHEGSHAKFRKPRA